MRSWSETRVKTPEQQEIWNDMVKRAKEVHTHVHMSLIMRVQTAAQGCVTDDVFIWMVHAHVYII